MDYVALQVKTSYSLLESLNTIPALVKKAVALGYKSLAITDNNNMFGVIEFYLECNKYNIKPIIGLELDVNDSKLLLYARNNQGYNNLIKLSTIKSDRDLTLDDLIKYKDNLILIMPFLFFNKNIYEIYEERFVGYDNLNDKARIKEPKVFINDVSYLNKEEHKYLDYLYMIKLGKVLGEYELNTHQNKYLLSKEEVSSFIDESDLKNINYIVSNCNVKIGYTPNLLPVYDANIDAYTYLKSLSEKGLNKRLNGNVTLEYKKRLDYELSVIKKMGFCDYFLIVWDYVKYAKFNNILVGPGRGSAAGSLVSYTLGITDIDPIKYDLLFERFLNPERVTMPDIDIDFDAEKRNQVIDYVISKYGEKKVAGIITFNTLGAKQAIRDVARVMNLSVSSADYLSRLVGNSTLKEAYENNSSFKNTIDTNNEYKKLYQIATVIEGLPRHISIHAAGIVMSRINLDETIPLYKNQLGMYTTAYSMNYLEDLGLLKMDFLGISNLTLIDNVINKIRENEKINITFSKIPLDDKKTFDIFKKARTDGIFQFESPGMRKFLRKLKPTTFEDIVAALALYRPGPMANIDTYIRRKEGKEKIDYIHENLIEILKPTYGIIIYQEQIMQIARVLANYSLGEADILRRAMSKKKESVLLNEKPKFIERSMANGYTEEKANEVYDLILKFANYGFNRSHSVGYAVVAYKMAFLKTYFFKYFMAYLLTNTIGGETKTKRYINECLANKVKIIIPDINSSTNIYEITADGILCPLSIIKGVGTVHSNEIQKEREKGPFIDLIDFTKRLYKNGINKKIITSLINAGCFDKFGFNHQTMIENIDEILNYAELSQDVGMIEIARPELIIYDEYDKQTLIDKQQEVFGFYITEHPTSRYRNEETITSSLIENNFNKIITIVLQIQSIREIVTKKNDVMAFIYAGDEFGFVDLTLFPKTYNTYNDLKNGDIIKVIGRVERRYDRFQIIVNKVEVLNRK